MNLERLLLSASTSTISPLATARMAERVRHARGRVGTKCKINRVLCVQAQLDEASRWKNKWSVTAAVVCVCMSDCN